MDIISSMIIQNWAEVVVSSFQNLWVNAIQVLGNVVGALIVFIIGLIVASGIGALVEKLVSLVRLDSALRSLGLEDYFERGNLKMNSGRFLGRLVYWFLVVVFLLAASDILNFFALSSFLREVVLYVPNVVVAALIMLAAVVVANVTRKVVRSSIKSARLHSAAFLGSLVWYAIVIFGLLTSLSQLGIAVSIINALVTGFVAMLAIAGGLAFGLGGRDYAASLIAKLREHFER